MTAPVLPVSPAPDRPLGPPGRPTGGSTPEPPVGEIMKADPTTVGPEAPTVEAIQLMRKLRIGCLPVLQDGRLVGIVTEEDFLDLATKLLEQQLAGDPPKK